uniref:SERTA domain-containing protein n=1 Tax=Kryptolebias marmoratus TaxID=37003 RepID=A0A3Q3FT07_KRYMA
MCLNVTLLLNRVVCPLPQVNVGSCLCLKKLQDYQAGMELSLRRSVLLVNTLRQIQDEMQSDRTGSPDLHLHSINPDSCLLRDDFREDLLVTCPGCAVGNAEGLSPSLFPEFPSQEANGSSEQHKPLSSPSCSAVSDATNATGYLSDLALDDIFEDIDTSMYETSDLPSACAAGSLWPINFYSGDGHASLSLAKCWWHFLKMDLFLHKACAESSSGG